MTHRDDYWMGLALTLAANGRGSVEPNPMVGCVIVNDSGLIASGYHQFFGGPHAEVNAFAACDPKLIADATVYVTLEPCCHFGKTPPCVHLLLANPPKRVVVAMQDPYPEVSGRGIQMLRDRGIDVQIGVLESQSRLLNAPYLKRIASKMPWVIAKWAMTLDGAIATRDGSSKWISNACSRNEVHRLRNRVDSIIVGAGTALADDPLLTTRLPQGEKHLRKANRIVMDRRGRISADSQLAQSVDSGPVIVVTSQGDGTGSAGALQRLGCEVLRIPPEHESQSLQWLLRELYQRGETNVLVEGGGELLGHAFDQDLVDEVHCFIAPKIVGGQDAMRPIGGVGLSLMSRSRVLDPLRIRNLENDTYITGFVSRTALDQ